MRTIRRLFIAAAFTVFLPIRPQNAFGFRNAALQRNTYAADVQKTNTIPTYAAAVQKANTGSPVGAVSAHEPSCSPSSSVRTTSAKNDITLYTEKLPRIPHLSSRDDVFKQYGADVEENYKRSAAGKIKHAQFYAYTPTADDTLFTLAAACSIPYETIATVNGIANIGDMAAGKTIILPTDAGLFVPETPESSIEILIEKKYFRLMENVPKEWYSINGRRFYFLHGERFDSTERAFFLDADFKMPLDASWLSSAYGMRVSPISGEMRFHRGIDLAAPEGEPVYSCKSGSVIRCTKGDSIYGNYVVLRHDKGMTSIYAHLSDVLVHEGDIVTGRTRIGSVGKTGAATGAHLHFEIRVNGVSTDPRGLLPDYDGRQGR
ncbi:M23 family metallopeptidase [Treponema sp. Marseille-Q4130]|uniref:LysM peptidoglycan-binding domain-containing M23 family metallopeptidase n=1 Tax=Treponema sp. Marseille-Q4130 TaxID=2766702 RepID=UPI0016523FDF|nr:M23 family metallopeptidase [Treponema sp. Marseille-Q4130]MBC6720534.1 M23 family metallopeptidase [Treponema sp. Marseille-Q4130]